MFVQHSVVLCFVHSVQDIQGHWLQPSAVNFRVQNYVPLYYIGLCLFLDRLNFGSLVDSYNSSAVLV
jgi:hypothetical protein